jgi:hypothetical protein
MGGGDRRIAVWVQTGQKLSEKYTKNQKEVEHGSMVKHLASKHKPWVLTGVTQTEKKKRN